MRVLALGMETHVFDSCIRGHHVSKDFWMPVINEELVCVQESENPHDPYTVAIKKRSLVVGHVARKSSAVCSLFLHAGNYHTCDQNDTCALLLVD